MGEMHDWRSALQEAISNPLGNTNTGRNAAPLFREAIKLVCQIAPEGIATEIGKVMNEFSANHPSKHKKTFKALLDEHVTPVAAQVQGPGSKRKTLNEEDARESQSSMKAFSSLPEDDKVGSPP